MKKIINSLPVLFILLAILNACVSGSKMKNRHYQQRNAISESTEVAEDSEKTIVYIQPNKSIETEILHESISIHEIVAAEKIDLNSEHSTSYKSSTNQKENNINKHKIITEDFSLSDLKFKKQLKSSLFPSPSPATADLSLLWIVIIILLVLWALGLISGNFGGLIHLLLVIALILLILWLLKII